MNIFSRVIKQLNILFLFFFGLIGLNGFSQGASLSPYNLMESYFEKKASFEVSSSKSISSENKNELDRITSVLEENAPSSFEYHLVKYVNGNYDLSLKNHLFEAFKLKPDDKRVNLEMFGYYALTNDAGKIKEFAGKIKQNYTSNTLSYYQFMFASKTDGFLILSSEGDAFPALILQSQGKINAGLTIINLDFLQNDVYRKRIQDQIGGINMKFNGNEAAFVNALISSKSKKVTVSTTVSQAYLQASASSISITGLDYTYAPKNQKSELEAFWKKAQPFLSSITLITRGDKALYGNFLPPLLTLYKLKLGLNEKDESLRSGILLLARNVNKETAVTTIIKEYEQLE